MFFLILVVDVVYSEGVYLIFMNFCYKKILYVFRIKKLVKCCKISVVTSVKFFEIILN